jgi:transposase
VYLEIPIRRVLCTRCGKVKREALPWLADNPFYTKRFAYYVGRRCRAASIRDVAKDVHLDWHTVKELEKRYMREQLRRVGTPGPRVIGIDEVSIKKGHTYRVVVNDLRRERPIWFGGVDRSEASLDAFYQWLGPKKSKGIRIAVMDMWKAFLNATQTHTPQAAVLFDKFHVMRHLGEALDKVRRAEYHRWSGKDRVFVKGQRYALLSRWEHLSLPGRRALKKLLAANQRLQTAYLLKESFDQLWGYRRAGWARRFFDHWKDSLKWQRLKPFEQFAALVERNWSGVAAYCESAVLSGVRRGRQYQDPGHPAAGVRPPGRRVPSPEGAHLHAARDLTWPESTHSITR